MTRREAPAAPGGSIERSGSDALQVDGVQALLVATERLLQRRDLRSIKIQEIVSEVGINRATFYFYFTSKYAVVAQLLTRYRDEVLDAVEPWTGVRVSASDDDTIVDNAAYRDQLTTAFTQLVEVWQRHSALMRAASANWRVVPELRDVWQENLKWFVDASTARIEADRRLGIAPPRGDARRLATSLMLLNVAMLQNLADEGPMSLGPEHSVDLMCEIWIQSIYGTPDHS
ncbi:MULTISPECIES: TetR/AcrR family transcriptional regulator [Micrococcales]|uniref:TetR/AcrR family transcriptional regulator n=1 Tax=Micrococcales TaxID=85006 RepID=UPI001478EFE3|nr:MULTISPECIES: TetR/AcrR family transcriptional regulator [Micrococcales]